MIKDIKTQKEAEKVAGQLTEDSKFFCPLFGGDCNHRCPAFTPALVMRNPRENSWNVRDPECTAPSVV